MKGKRIPLVCILVATAAVLVAAVPVKAADAGIYPGDTLRITVLDEQDLTRQILVDASGNITMPLIGEVAVEGKTAQQAADDITLALKKYLKHPQVTVEVAIPAKRNAAISGAVKTPGLYPISPVTRVVDLIGLAGGHLPNADLTKVTVTGAETRETTTCNIQEVFAGRNPDANVLLKDGDSVLVPEYGTVLVMGQVKTPGTVPLTTNMTVREAIERAGGTIDQADTTKVTVTRADSGQSVTVNLAQAMQGDPSADVTLSKDDQVIVPAQTQVGKFTINAGVKNPGVYPIMGDNFTIIDAISAAGGLTPTAKVSKAQVLRGGKSIPVDLAAVYASKAPNVPILPNDSIVIAESNGRSDPLRILGTAAMIFRIFLGF